MLKSFESKFYFQPTKTILPVILIKIEIIMISHATFTVILASLELKVDKRRCLKNDVGLNTPSIINFAIEIC